MAADSFGDNQGLSIGPFRLEPGRRLADVTAPVGDIIAIADHRDYPKGLYAVLVDSSVSTRLDLKNLLKGFPPLLQPLIYSDIIAVPHERKQKLGLVFEKLAGPPIMPNLSQTAIKPFSDERIKRQIITPLLPLLAMMSEKGVFHGRIRPDTLHLSSTGEIGLAECVSCLPGFDQPQLFEPLERAMTHPAGRGEGSISDDLFSFGMTLLFLCIGTHPFPHMSPDAIMRTRLEEGTWGMILNRVKVPASMIELLRGLLADSPKQRWEIQDLDDWITGQRIALKPAVQPPRATRALELHGQSYYRARTFAYAIPYHISELRPMIERGEVDGWLRRGVGDIAQADYLTRVLNQSSSLHQDDETLACYTSMGLDPGAPVRYKGLSVLPGGVGGLMAEVSSGRIQGSTQTILDMIAQGILNDWLSAPSNIQPLNVFFNKHYENCQRFLEQKGSGYGLERILYETNKNIACQSDMFKSMMVLIPGDLLLALEQVAQGGAGRPALPLDRHGAAFLAARYPSFDNNMAKSLSDRDVAERNMTMMYVLADIQKKYGHYDLPALAGWFVELAKPVLDRFHSRKIRSDLSNNLGKLSKKGDLRAVYELLDNPNINSLDATGYTRARQEYHIIASQIEHLKNLLAHKDQIGAQMGRRAAATVSTVLGLLGIAGVLIMYLGH